MQICVFCGKGGVGKTNSAVSFGVYSSQQLGKKTVLVDYDGGHSVTGTLGITRPLRPNEIHHHREKLDVVVIENTPFVGIAKAKATGKKLSDYLEQFPGDYGLIPFADMMNAFFGIPTDVPTLQKYSTLVVIFQQLKSLGYEQVIIDVEPTAGFERLISNADSTVRSLKQLSGKGLAFLALVGAKWPDVAGYLRSDYIRNIDTYSVNILRMVTALRHAKYFLVAIPEAIPVKQTFEVRQIIESFGGRIQGYIVNNIRGESYEGENIARLERNGECVLRIAHRKELHSGHHNKLAILAEIGEAIASEM